MINESSDTARDSMKAIRKRLQQNAGKNHTTIMYTLTVLETCVKNCGKAFHILVSNKEFAQELVKIIGPKYDPPPIVQEKVLSLIQIWADAFRKQPDLQGVVQVYQELKNKGVEFPMTDIDSLAPIYTPQRVSKIYLILNFKFLIFFFVVFINRVFQKLHVQYHYKQSFQFHHSMLIQLLLVPV